MTTSFAETFKMIGRGDLLVQADEVLTDLVEAVMKTGKGGTMTITIGVKINDDSSLKLEGKIGDKRPKETVGDSIFFVRDNLQLTREDPRQESLKLTRVNDPVPFQRG